MSPVRVMVVALLAPLALLAAGCGNDSSFTALTTPEPPGEDTSAPPTEEVEDDGRRPEDEALELLQVDRIALEIGYRLIPLVQDKNGTGILDHVAQLRRRFASRDGPEPEADGLGGKYGGTDALAGFWSKVLWGSTHGGKII